MNWLQVTGAFGALVLLMQANADIVLRDPTRPLDEGPKIAQVENEQPAQLSLDSILISEHRRHAVVNGQRLRLGDSLAGLKVVKIEHNSIVLADSERLIRLQLGNGAIKKPSRQSDIAMRARP